jgi:hypothetical protein
VLVFILLGASTTILMAWAIALSTQLRWTVPLLPKARLLVQSESDQGWMRVSNPGYRVDVREDLAWPIDVPDDWPAPRFGAVGWAPGVSGTRAWFEHYSGGGRIPAVTPYYGAGRSHVGLPLAALSYEDAFTETPPALDLGVWRMGIPLWHGEYGIERRLPVMIRWPGFVIDTLFWGAMWLALLAAIRSLRARCRSKRGLCARCRYELAGLTVCPECGTPDSRSPSLSP